ncbi:MAG: TonB family protein [Acidobacteriota bacterium]
MRSPSFTTAKSTQFAAAVLALVLLAGSRAAYAKDLRIAVIAPDKSVAGKAFVSELSTSLALSSDVLDDSLVWSAFDAVGPTTPYNMTTAEARNFAAALGCDFVVLVRAGDQRRSSSEREEYYESYASIFAVSAKTGRLVDWSDPQFESSKPADASRSLKQAIPSLAAALVKRLEKAAASESAEISTPRIEEMPPDGSPLLRELRPPVPYRRLKPEYTSLAFLYEIAATVELELDLDASGEITRTEIVRWAGYGLDESVQKAVRAMNWRPAERNGKPLPMRVLLRYNFKKVDK